MGGASDRRIRSPFDFIGVRVNNLPARQTDCRTLSVALNLIKCIIEAFDRAIFEPLKSIVISRDFAPEQSRFQIRE